MLQLNNLDFKDMDTYLDNSRINVSRIVKRLDNYINEASEDHIHDLRTAIRRFEATYRTLPKKIRNKKSMRKYYKISKDLFRLNSEIRDHDIIIEKMEKSINNPNEDSRNRIESLKLSLLNERKLRISEAHEKAMELIRLSIPSFFNDPKISYKKLKKRYNKVVKQFVKRIEENFPIVVSNSNEVIKIHELRKDCKKLRYLYELVLDDKESQKIQKGKSSNNCYNIYEKNEVTSKVIGELEKIQDILGEIHDYDRTLDYLKQQQNEDLTVDIMNNIQKAREKKYKDFIGLYKDNSPTLITN